MYIKSWGFSNKNTSSDVLWSQGIIYICFYLFCLSVFLIFFGGNLQAMWGICHLLRLVVQLFVFLTVAVSGNVPATLTSPS